MKGYISHEEMWEMIKDANIESKRMVENAEKLSKLMTKIIDIRIEKGLTQKDLAKITGLKQSAIARFESMNVMPNLSTLINIASALGVVLLPVEEHQISFWLSTIIQTDMIYKLNKQSNAQYYYTIDSASGGEYATSKC